MVTITNKTLKTNKIRNAEYYDMVETFDELYADSKNGRSFKNLYEIIISENNIKLAYRYTSEGRQEIHKKLGVNSSMIQYMLRNPIMNRSIEYNDNRISLYSGQQGKCFVTKAELTMDNMHCHHKIPLHKGGTDEYANLVLVTEDVHVLIHAESEEVILKKIKLIRPDEKMRKKIDTLRRKAEISKIIWESYTF